VRSVPGSESVGYGHGKLQDGLEKRGTLVWQRDQAVLTCRDVALSPDPGAQA